MALASMGDWEAIISGGDRWDGHTGAQIACLFVSHGLLDQLGDVVPPEEASKGFGKFGFSFSMN